jgi:hypothetical protein
MPLSKIDSDSLNTPITAADLAYTGTLTGSTGIVNIGSGQVYKDASGNVGIGTASPTVKLELVAGTGSQSIGLFRTGDATAANNAGGGFNAASSATAGSRNARIWLDADGANFAGSDYFYIDKTGGSGNVAFIQQSTAAMTFATDGTERARIESGGSLLMTTSRSTARGRVDIPDTGGTQSVPLAISRGGDAGTMVNFFSTNSTTTTIGTIGNSGNTNTTYNTSSDYRLKENIVPMSRALDTVAALKPVTWNWKSTGADGQGFIAHELAEVVPDCVTGEKDAVDGEGNPVHQGVDTSYLVATLTAAIQELKAIVDAQGAEIAALKGTP